MQETVDETIAAPTSNSDHTGCVFFGDPVSSIRQLLKRYNYIQTLVPIASDNGEQVYNWILSDFPMYRGYAPGAVHEASVPADPTDYNYAKMTMLNYYVPGFTCWRGGLRWKYQLMQDNSLTTSYMAAYRDPNPDFAYGQGSVALLADTTSVSARTANWLSAMESNFFSGAQVTAASVNPVVEVELPYFNNRRFSYAKQANVTTLATNRLMHRLDVKLNYSSGSYDSIQAYCSVGEDFTLGFFTGAPVAYYQADPTAA
jgi:hypothetical protein